MINIQQKETINTFHTGPFLCLLTKKDLEEIINKNKVPFGRMGRYDWSLIFETNLNPECILFVFTDTKLPEFQSYGIWGKKSFIPAIYFDCTEQRFIEKAKLVYQIKYED